jgi:hypothetical protein
MKVRPSTLVAGIASLAVSGWIVAQEAAQTRQYSLPGHGSLVLKVPSGWRALDRSLPKPPSVLLRFAPASGDAFKVQVTTAWIEPAKRDSSPASLKERVQATAKNLLKQSVEAEATILELRGDHAQGYYFSLTDRGQGSGPDDYKYLTQGTVLTGELTIVFTILQREPGLPDRERALRMFADAVHSKTELPAAAPDTSERLRIFERERVYELSVPVSRLVMTIPREGLTKMPMGTHPRYFYFAGEMIVSGWFESGQRFKGIPEFWKSETDAWKRQGLAAPVDVVFAKEGSWEVIAYDMPTKLGSIPNLRAHWVQAGTWIDMHISMPVKSGPGARSKLLELLRSIEVRERE